MGIIRRSFGKVTPEFSAVQTAWRREWDTTPGRANFAHNTGKIHRYQSHPSGRDHPIKPILTLKSKRILVRNSTAKSPHGASVGHRAAPRTTPLCLRDAERGMMCTDATANSCEGRQVSDFARRSREGNIANDRIIDRESGKCRVRVVIRVEAAILLTLRI